MCERGCVGASSTASVFLFHDYQRIQPSVFGDLSAEKAQLNRRDRRTDGPIHRSRCGSLHSLRNGPEFIVEAVKLIIKGVGAKTAYSGPRSRPGRTATARALTLVSGTNS
jgi:hypothetical protein